MWENQSRGKELPMTRLGIVSLGIALFVTTVVHAGQTSIRVGYVVDAGTGVPIGGATLRIVAGGGRVPDQPQHCWPLREQQPTEASNCEQT